MSSRVLLRYPLDRVLLIHAHDPEDPARRELAEESRILLPELGHKLWVRESRFRYRGRAHHRIEHVFLGRTKSV